MTYFKDHTIQWFRQDLDFEHLIIVCWFFQCGMTTCDGCHQMALQYAGNSACE